MTGSEVEDEKDVRLVCTWSFHRQKAEFKIEFGIQFSMTLKILTRTLDCGNVNCGVVIGLRRFTRNIGCTPERSQICNNVLDRLNFISAILPVNIAMNVVGNRFLHCANTHIY